MRFKLLWKGTFTKSVEYNAALWFGPKLVDELESDDAKTVYI